MSTPDVAAGDDRRDDKLDNKRDGKRDDKKVVRYLTEGQEVKGVIKRVAEFGAFVDIGVGREGLVHVSELSTGRVNKVSDVLAQGQEFTFWIKKLDRENNRISLTMISPGTKTVRDLSKGDLVTGTVTRMVPFGAFIDIGVGRDALLHVREMGERFIAKPEDVVKIGEQVEARIIELNRFRQRIDLSIKGLRPEPEPEPEPVVEETTRGGQSGSSQYGSGQFSGNQAGGGKPREQEPEAVDIFADMPVLSPIEAALKRAMEASGTTKLTFSRDQRKPPKETKAKARAVQEDLLARTLKGAKA